MKDDLLGENRAQFLEKFVEEFRKDDAAKLGAADAAHRVSKSLGVGSAVMDLTFGALSDALSGEDVDLPLASRMIEASASLAYGCGKFVEKWLDPFGRNFINGLNATKQLPLPECLELNDNARTIFGSMLQIAVGVAEDKNKVGKVSLKKCTGFSLVKWWSECEGWRGGFTYADRRRLEGIAQCIQKMLPHGEDASVSIGDVAEVGRLNEKLREANDKLAELKKEKGVLGYKVENAQKRICAKDEELVTLKEKIEKLEEVRDDLKRRVDKETEEKNKLQEELQSQRSSSENQRIELNRQIEEMRQQASADRIRIGEKMSTGYQQYKSIKESSMTVELGEALRIQLGRAYDVLQQFGVNL